VRNIRVWESGVEEDGLLTCDGGVWLEVVFCARARLDLSKRHTEMRAVANMRSILQQAATAGCPSCEQHLRLGNPLVKNRPKVLSSTF